MTTSVGAVSIEAVVQSSGRGEGRDLRPWYAETGTTELVGEAWLTGPQCVVETGSWRGRRWLRLRRSRRGLLGGGSFRCW